MQTFITPGTHNLGRSQAFPDPQVTAMPDSILVRPKPDFNKIAYQFKPRIHLSVTDEYLFLSSDSVNWVLKMDRGLALELARKMLELENDMMDGP